MVFAGCAIGGCSDDSSSVILIVLGIIILISIACFILYLIKRKNKKNK